MKNKTVGILGLGVFGSSIVKTLYEYECDIIAIDKHAENINRIESCLTKGVIGDITDAELLERVGIGNCDVVVISTGTRLEASVLAVMHCKKLNVPEIVAKTTNSTSTEVLLKIGADRVISPEEETGARIARNILHRHIADVFYLDKNISIVEFFPPKDWVGKSLIQVNPRKNHHINLVGFRENPSNRLNTQLTTEYIFSEKELLVGISDEHHIDLFIGSE